MDMHLGMPLMNSKPIKRWSWHLIYTSEELRADKEVVMAAVKNDGFALEYASEELKADREVVMAAVKNDGDALYFATDEMRTLLSKSNAS